MRKRKNICLQTHREEIKKVYIKLKKHHADWRGVLFIGAPSGIQNHACAHYWFFAFMRLGASLGAVAFRCRSRGFALVDVLMYGREQKRG